MSTAFKSDSKSFPSKTVTQIGFVVKDIEKSAKVYADLFSMDMPDIILTDGYEKTNAEYMGQAMEAKAKLAFIHMENITLELIEPVGKPSTWADFLEQEGEGIHHIAFQVPNMKDATVVLEKSGGKLVQKGDFTGGSYAYVDATSPLGVIVELLTIDK